MNYGKIIKLAYTLTKSHSVLWLFGLLMSGILMASLMGWAKPQMIGFLILLWFIYNWGNVTFILFASDLLDLERIRFSQKEVVPTLSSILKESIALLIPITILTLFTTSVIVLNYFSFTYLLEPMPGVAGFAFLSLFFLVIHVFCCIFICMYRKSLISSVQLSVDLVIKKWKIVLEGVVVYLLLSIVYIFLGRIIMDAYRHFLWFNFSFVIQLALWLLSGIFSAFINLCVIIFFSELIKPIKDKEKTKVVPELNPVTAVSN